MNNEIRMRYEEPSLDIVVFNVEDVITGSGFDGEIDPAGEDGEDVVLPKVNFNY